MPRLSAVGISGLQAGEDVNTSKQRGARSMTELIQPYPTDPRIGILMRVGVHVFYAYLSGHGNPPFEGTLAEVERALGVVPASGATPPKVISNPKPRKTVEQLSRRYLVSVVPEMVTYSSQHTHGAWSEHLYAESNSKAVSEMRRRIREENGRHDIRYKITARIDE